MPLSSNMCFTMPVTCWEMESFVGRDLEVDPDWTVVIKSVVDAASVYITLEHHQTSQAIYRRIGLLTLSMMQIIYKVKS